MFRFSCTMNEMKRKKNKLISCVRFEFATHQNTALHRFVKCQKNCSLACIRLLLLRSLPFWKQSLTVHSIGDDHTQIPLTRANTSETKQKWWPNARSHLNWLGKHTLRLHRQALTWTIVWCIHTNVKMFAPSPLVLNMLKRFFFALVMCVKYVCYWENSHFLFTLSDWIDCHGNLHIFLSSLFFRC